MFWYPIKVKLKRKIDSKISFTLLLNNTYIFYFVVNKKRDI